MERIRRASPMRVVVASCLFGAVAMIALPAGAYPVSCWLGDWNNTGNAVWHIKTGNGNQLTATTEGRKDPIVSDPQRWEDCKFAGPENTLTCKWTSDPAYSEKGGITGIRCGTLVVHFELGKTRETDKIKGAETETCRQMESLRAGTGMHTGAVWPQDLTRVSPARDACIRQLQIK